MAHPTHHSVSTRLGEELASILRTVRYTARTPQMMDKGLDAVMSAVAAEGVAVVRLTGGQDAPKAEILHHTGQIGDDIATASMLLLRAEIGEPAMAREPDGRSLIAAICRDSGTETRGLLAWRAAGTPAWTGADAALVDATAGIVCLLSDADADARQAVEAARIDPLTALLDRRSFVADVSRHMARLRHDGSPGTLMLAAVDNLDNATSLLGAERGNQVLRRAAVLLRNTVRPSDVVGRLEEAEFAVWIDGADYLTAAERAEALCLKAPDRIVGPRHAMLPGVSFSIGIATSRAGESFDDLLRRADKALGEVKLAGGGYWRVSLDRAA